MRKLIEWRQYDTRYDIIIKVIECSQSIKRTHVHINCTQAKPPKGGDGWCETFIEKCSKGFGFSKMKISLRKTKHLIEVSLDSSNEMSYAFSIGNCFPCGTLFLV